MYIYICIWASKYIRLSKCNEYNNETSLLFETYINAIEWANNKTKYIYICVYKVSALVCAPAYIHTNTICEYWAHICMIWSSQLQFGTSKKRWRWWWWWCFAAFICVSNCIISKTNSAYWNMRIYLCIRSRKICSILFYTFFAFAHQS